MFPNSRRASDTGRTKLSISSSGTIKTPSHQIGPTKYWRFELDLEYFEEGFQGADEAAVSPILYTFFGKGIYGGVGVGVTYSEAFEDDVSDAFYAARAGFNVDLLPRLSLDIHGNYRFDDWELLDQSSSDTITLGALLRIDL